MPTKWQNPDRFRIAETQESSRRRWLPPQPALPTLSAVTPSVRAARLFPTFRVHPPVDLEHESRQASVAHHHRSRLRQGKLFPRLEPHRCERPGSYRPTATHLAEIPVLRPTRTGRMPDGLRGVGPSELGEAIVPLLEGCPQLGCDVGIVLVQPFGNTSFNTGTDRNGPDTSITDNHSTWCAATDTVSPTLRQSSAERQTPERMGTGEDQLRRTFGGFVRSRARSRQGSR